MSAVAGRGPLSWEGYLATYLECMDDGEREYRDRKGDRHMYYVMDDAQALNLAVMAVAEQLARIADALEN